MRASLRTDNDHGIRAAFAARRHELCNNWENER